MQGLDIRELKDIYGKGFAEDTKAYTDFFFEKYVKPENIVTYKEYGKIISAGYIIEKPAIMFGKETVFPYVTALSTLPEYRGKGKIKSVLLKAFEILHKRGYAYFGLHPFDYDYYKRFGLGNISYACHSTITGGQKYTVVDYSERYFDTVKRIYDQMSSKFYNRLLLTKDTFALKIGEYAADGISCKLLFDDGQCFAFAFVDKNNIDYYATTDSGKFSRAEYFKGYSYCDFSRPDSPYLQGRVIDVKKAVKQYYSENPPHKELRFRVTDGLIEENNICVSVKIKDGKVVMTDCDFAENTYGIGEFTENFFNNVKNFFPDKY